MKRIVIIGSGGAGKSTLARQMGDILGVEVIHLDGLYWKPGWVNTPSDQWRTIVEGLLARESWVMDGNYSGTLDIRIPAADTIVYLDFATAVCVWRIFRRLIQYRHRQRPDMPPDCPEKVGWDFFLWVTCFRRQRRSKILRLIDEHSDGKRVVILRTPREAQQFLDELRAQRNIAARQAV